MLKVISDNSSVRSIAVIGSGLAGLTAAILLGQSGNRVTVFEKSRGPGGRLASKRVMDGSADIGAQFFTIRHPGFRIFLHRWAGEDSFAVWEGSFGFQGACNSWQPFKPEHRYVGVPRMTAITRSLSRHVQLQTGVRIARLEVDNSQWQLCCTKGGKYGGFDQVVITAPPAQARELLLDSQLNSLAAGLDEPVERLLPCWAVAAHYAQPVDAQYDAMRPNSPVLYWLANNSSKPERYDSGCWWVMHATPEWTLEHLNTEPQTVAKALTSAFADLCGDTQKPDQTLAHRWLYARSASGDTPGYMLNKDLGIGLAGDWLAGGRVEGAWESARRLVQAMAC